MNLAFSKSAKSEEEIHYLLENYASFGFEGLHLYPNQFRSYLDDPQGMADKYGSNWGFALGLINIGPLDEAAIAHLRQVFLFAQDLGSDSIIYCLARPNDQTDRQALRDLSQCFSELGREAKDMGLRLSIHNHVGQALMTRDDISTFIEAGDAEAFGLTLDTAHLAKAGVTEISDLIYEYRDYLHNLHLQDFSEGKFVSLGEGDLDYRAILDMVQSFNFSGWVCVEDQSNASVEEALQLCEKSLRNYDI